MKATTVKETLIAAKWILDNVGWCQGSYYKTKGGEKRYDVECAADVGCACAVGSIYLVDVADSKLHQDAVEFLEDSTGMNNIVAWNDKSGRTQKEVSKLFGKAIKKAK